MKRKTVLVVEDDAIVRSDICERLHDRALDTLEAANEAEALRMIRSAAKQVDVALIDVCLPLRASRRAVDRPYGRRSGLRVARIIRDRYPNTRLIGMSQFADEEVRSWFAEYGSGFLPKSWLFRGAAGDFVDAVEHCARKRYHKRKPRTFVVHGQDNPALLSLLTFIQRNLGWPAPSILRELPSHGRTIIEKFEDVAETVDVVFVLLTPDDKIASPRAPNDSKRRARQNVIFELGYFYAKLQRSGGRVILLYRGHIELPSDIAGIVYVDISKGVEASGEALRRELAQWLD